MDLGPPAEIYAGQGIQIFVAVGVVGLQSCSDVAWQRPVATRLEWLQAVEADPFKPEEVPDPVELSVWVGEQPFALQDQELIAGEQVQQTAELLGVVPTRQVAVMPVLEALVGRVRDETFLLAFEPVGLAVEGDLEGQGLVAKRHFMLVVGPCPGHRFPEYHDEADRWQRLGDPPRRQWVEHVVGAGLAGDLPWGTRAFEPGPEPPLAPVEVHVEVVRPLPGTTRCHVGVLGYPVSGRGRAATFGAHDEVARFHDRSSGQQWS